MVSPGTGSSQWCKPDKPDDLDAGAFTLLKDDGSAMILSKDGKTVLWETNTKVAWPPAKRDRLEVVEALYPGDKLVSPNGRFSMVIQQDANFVLFDGQKRIWGAGVSSGSSPRTVQLGEDDNLVVERSGAPWESATRRQQKGGHGTLILRDQGAAVILSESVVIWSTDQKLVQPWEPLDVSQVSTSPKELYM